MKTFLSLFPKLPLNPIVGFLSIFVMASCGSYQNTSYYDNDGIYGASERSYSPRETQNESSTAYKNYFGSLQDSVQKTQIITDVENYSNYNATNNQQSNTSYPGWGSNSQDVVINYYPNNWGLSFGFGHPYHGFGWNNSFFGWNSPFNYWNNFYGWDYPFYGYGFNNFFNYGWGNPYFGNSFGHSYRNTNYSYNSSRRGSSYTNSVGSSRNYIGRTSSQDVSRYSNRGDGSPSFGRYSSSNQNQNFSNSNYNIGRTRGNNNYNSAPTQNYNTPSRTYSPNATRRSDDYTPSRSYTPSTNRNDSYTPSRSSDSNYSRSSGGESSYGGGGRSYGGGGGGGRRGGR